MIKENYLNNDIFGEDLRQFCMQSERFPFFKNLKTRMLNIPKSYEQLLPKHLASPELMKLYQAVLEECDKVLHTFQYGLEYMNVLIAAGDLYAIDRWHDVIGEFSNVYRFLEDQEALLKQRCEILWNEGFYDLVRGEQPIVYPIVAAELPSNFWCTAVTDPIVASHVIPEETRRRLKVNEGGLLYKITKDNLITMSATYGEYRLQEECDVVYSFQFPEIERMLIWPNVNKYYDFELRLEEDDMFYTPENFVKQAMEKLGTEGVRGEHLGLGRILLKNDVKYLYGIFYSEGSDDSFKEKVQGFSQVFGTHVFEVKKDGTLEQVFQTGRQFY